MKIIYSEKHKLRDAKTELHGGELVKPFEGPFRAEWIMQAVKDAGFNDISAPADHGLDVAMKVHDRGYLEFLSTAWARWAELGFEGEAIPITLPVRRMQMARVPTHIEGALGYYANSAETSISPGTYEAAVSSQNCAVEGADWLNAGNANCFSLCRPPGHHAGIDLFGGYCFINNAAVAAQRLLDHGAKRVAILDVDFHHGNGTQDITYKRGDIFFASLHGDPLEAFPHFLGFADETGEGAGEGANANYPLQPGTPWNIWSEALTDALSRIKAYGAEAIVVSLGVDTFENDPISFFKLKSENFTSMGAMIAASGIPVLTLMEGGYGVAEIGLNVANFLKGVEGRA